MRGSLALRNELAAFGEPHSDKDWYIIQVEFLSAHRYFTQAARRLHDAQKARNIESMKQLLAAVPETGG
jgi:hypothetical protein